MDRYRLRSQSVFMLVLVLCCVMAFIYNVVEFDNANYVITAMINLPLREPFKEEQVSKGFAIKTRGCTIPDLDPHDFSIQSFVFNEDPVICNSGLPFLFDSNKTSLFLVESSLDAYNISDTSKLVCCYQEFYRSRDDIRKADLDVTYVKNCAVIEGNSTAVTNKEFVRVRCLYDGVRIYEDYFHFVPIKNTIKLTKESPKGLNVLFVGLDSVSRPNLYRQMPQTVNVLRELNSIELMGFNKVGDNTFPNLIPVLTGMSDEELQSSCWKNNDNYFDNCQFIWKNFSAASYTTAFGEDSSWMGLFYYTRKGFKNVPTDYFYDHFDYEAQKKIGNEHRLNVHQCYGSRLAYRIFIKYILNFTETMLGARRKFFGFFWGSSLSHDFLNKPRLGDEDYAKMLRSLNTSGVLNETALVFLSDHGMRWGDIRSTYQGRMEERLPFVHIVLPQWFKERNWVALNNLRTNRRRLTTPFDLHETLKDFLKDGPLENGTVDNTRGVSLFRSISGERTCLDAGIETHWCTCQTSKPMPLDDQDIIDAVNFTINGHINKLLIGYAECAQLELDEILDAQLQENDESLTGKHSINDYTVTFRAIPGGGIFETTIRKLAPPPPKAGPFSVTGTVSRINLYGSQSKCITDFHLKLYCYCK